MNSIHRHIILSVIFLSSVAFISCGDDNDIVEPLPKFIENLPSPENVRSTSVFIPVYDEGNIGLLLARDETFSFCIVQFISTYLEDDFRGFLVSGLEPDCTYYYTMRYHGRSEGIYYSKQVKSFTTKGVSIAFIEPATKPMGSWEEKALRVKTSGVEEIDVHNNLYVLFHNIRDDSDGLGISFPTYLGDGVWQCDNWPREGDHWWATIECKESRREVARTPLVTLKNGMLVEE